MKNLKIPGFLNGLMDWIAIVYLWRQTSFDSCSSFNIIIRISAFPPLTDILHKNHLIVDFPYFIKINFRIYTFSPASILAINATGEF